MKQQQKIKKLLSLLLVVALLVAQLPTMALAETTPLENSSTGGTIVAADYSDDWGGGTNYRR